jgi:hypothetical protein
LWRRPRPKLGCGAKERRKKKKKKKFVKAFISGTRSSVELLLLVFIPPPNMSPVSTYVTHPVCECVKGEM